MLFLPIGKIILIFGIFFILTFLAYRLLLKRGRKFNPYISSPPIINLITTQWIAPKKYISIIDIGGELFAIGISESQITLLTKIEDKEWAKKILENRGLKTSPMIYIQNYLFKNRLFSRFFLRSLNAK